MLEIARERRKRVVVLGHSIGPFWKPRSITRIREVFRQLGRISVREDISRDHLIKVGLSPRRVRTTGDIAFLWRRMRPDLFQPKSGDVRVIGMCFRAWPLNDSSKVSGIIEKATRLCEFLFSNAANEIMFLSTCQGIMNYIDDSEMAIKVVKELPAHLQKRCHIDRARYSPDQLISRLGECDAFIGMRLHACILSMIGGTPAMGFAYEDKTPGIYDMLGMAEYQTDHRGSFDSWKTCAQQFLTDQPRLCALLPSAVDEMCVRAQGSFEILKLNS